MSHRDPRRRHSVAVFDAVIAEVERRWVLPRCRRCLRPCCNLETLVLELDWRRLRLLWGIPMSRRRFDARLAEGRGPPEVRARDGLYYVHGRACPAYRDRRCAVYDSDLKPTGCGDFPLYVDDDESLLADLRCEALSLEKVESALIAKLPAGTEFLRGENPDFPFLVTFRIASGAPARRTRGARSRKRRARRSLKDRSPTRPHRS